MGLGSVHSRLRTTSFGRFVFTAVYGTAVVTLSKFFILPECDILQLHEHVLYVHAALPLKGHQSAQATLNVCQIPLKIFFILRYVSILLVELR